MYLWDHRVAGRGLLPAAAFLEVATSALRLIHDAPTALCGTAITSPLVLPSAGTPALTMCSVDLHTGAVQLSSSVNGRPHLTSQSTAIQVQELKRPTTEAGATYGPAMHAVHHAAGASPTSLGRIAHDAAVVGGENSGLYMPPAVLDANLQLAGASQGVSASSQLHIPAGIDAYWIVAKHGSAAAWATATPRARNMSDHNVFAESSRVIHLAGLEVKPAGATGLCPRPGLPRT